MTIPEEGLKDFLHEFNRERLLNRFENGERHISFRYWTRTATFEPMLAEDHMALYREEKTGDVIAVKTVQNIIASRKKSGHWKNQTESMRSFWKKRKSIRL